MEESNTGYSKTIRRLVIVVSIGLALHVLFLLLTVDVKSFSLLKNISFLNLSLICLLAICPWLFHALRIVMWSRFIKHPMKFREILPVVIVNDLGAALTPTAVGGGPVKLALLIKKGMPPTKATFLIFLSAAEDVFFYLVGILLSVFYLKSTIANIVVAIASQKFLLISILAFIFLPIIFRKNTKKILRFLVHQLPEKWVERISKVRKKFSEYVSDIGSTFKSVIIEGKLRLALSLVILFFQWITKFSILAVILYSLGIDFTWFDMYIKQWLISVSMLVFPTPGGSGGSEAAFLYLFGKDIGGDLSNLIVSTWRFFTYYFILIISVITLNIFNKELLK